MLSFLARRLVQLVPTLFFVSVLIFALQQLLPGDPALVMAGEERDPAVIEQIRKQYRLDQPVPVQYVYWVKGVLSGDLGESLRIKVPVRDLIAQKLPVTLQLASMAIVIAFLIGIPAGIVSAVKKGTAWDYGANLFALWGISTPNFWLGIMLIFLFSIELGWLPASGYVPLSENWRASLASTIMPAFVLGNAIAAILMRHTRSAMLTVLESDYVRTARAKGLLERTVILKHAMRNALTPVITLGALELGTLLSGAVLTEQIFSIPGFGKLIVDAVFNRDYAVVQGVVLVTATIYRVRKAPSLAHWFGTDDVGRDVLSRVIYGARASLLAGCISIVIALSIGVPLGLIAGYLGGFVDAVLSRITDAMLAIPFLILAIALAAFLGPSLGNAMIAIGVTTTPIFVRLTRGQVMAVKVEDYVEAARAIGNPRWRIALFHILPNILPALLVQGTLSIAAAIIAEAALSFLGLGQQPPAPSWGSMLNSAQRFLTTASWMAIWPGLAIFLTVLSFNLVGDGLRDALDPKER